MICRTAQHNDKYTQHFHSIT